MLTGREMLALMIAGWINNWLKPKSPEQQKATTPKEPPEQTPKSFKN